MSYEKRRPQGVDLRRFGNAVSAGGFDNPEDSARAQQSQGFRTLGEVAIEVFNELAYRRRVQRLWRLGPRATGALLLELAAISGRRTWLDGRLDAYAALNPTTVAALGATDWPAPPLSEVGR